MYISDESYEVDDSEYFICQIHTEEEDTINEALNEMVAQELTEMVKGWDRGE